MSDVAGISTPPVAGDAPPARILLVDDDPGLLRLLSIRLMTEGFDVEGVESAMAALDAAENFQPDLIITDLRMDQMDGIELLQSLQRRWPGLPVLLMTAHGTIPDAVTATQSGAFGFITKPIDKTELLDYVARALRVSRKSVSNEDWRAGIITRSPLINERLGQARVIAATPSRVLIRGPSGAGKEMFARAMHKVSPQKNGPFLSVGCSALSEDALAAELFGRADQPGHFQRAEGGILLLNEVADLPPALQVRLLRVLEEGAVRPVDSDQTVAVNVRIFCTTKQDLSALILDGRFRDDLYYRLIEASLEVPPLGEHREDIPILAGHFLEQIVAEMPGRNMVYAPEAIEILMGAPWPGNVRELGNKVRQHAAMCQTSVISASLVQESLGGEKSETLMSFAEARDEFIRNYLAQLLKMTGGNVSKAARMAQRNRTDFYKLLARHKLDPEVFKHGQP